MATDEALGARTLKESYRSVEALRGALTYEVLRLATDPVITKVLGPTHVAASPRDTSWAASGLLIDLASGVDGLAYNLRVELYRFVQANAHLRYLNRDSNATPPDYLTLHDAPKYSPEGVPKIAETYKDGILGLQQLLDDGFLEALNDRDIFPWLPVSARTEAQAEFIGSRWKSAGVIAKAISKSDNAALHVGVFKHFKHEQWARDRLQNPNAPIPMPISMVLG